MVVKKKASGEVSCQVESKRRISAQTHVNFDDAVPMTWVPCRHCEVCTDASACMGSTLTDEWPCG